MQNEEQTSQNQTIISQVCLEYSDWFMNQHYFYAKRMNIWISYVSHEVLYYYNKFNIYSKIFLIIKLTLTALLQKTNSSLPNIYDNPKLIFA